MNAARVSNLSIILDAEVMEVLLYIGYVVFVLFYAIWMKVYHYSVYLFVIASV